MSLAISHKEIIPLKSFQLHKTTSSYMLFLCVWKEYFTRSGKVISILLNAIHRITIFNVKLQYLLQENKTTFICVFYRYFSSNLLITENILEYLRVLHLHKYKRLSIHANLWVCNLNVFKHFVDMSSIIIAFPFEREEFVWHLYLATRNLTP